MRTRLLFCACALFVAVTGRAEEAPEVEPTPDLTRVRLLDEVPNYAEVLVEQWSPGVFQEQDEIGRAGRNYGLLVEEGPLQSLTLQESIALAIRNNTQVKIQALSPIFASNEVRDARSVFDPEIFGDASKTRSKTLVNSSGAFTSTGGDRFDQEVTWNTGARKTLLTGGQLALEWTNRRISEPTTFVNQLRPYYLTALNLSLNQPLLRDFGWRHALLLVDVAKTNEEQAYYTYRAGLADIVERVESAYWRLVLAIQNVRVEEQSLEASRELLRQNEGRYKVGAMPKTAVLEAQADVAQREAQLVRSNNLLQNARDNLRALLNARRDDGESLIMIEPADKPFVGSYEIDLQQSLARAAVQRPELIAARLDVDSKQILRKVAENQLLPRLDFIGSIGTNGLGGDDTGKRFPPLDGGEPTGPNPRVLGGYGQALDFLDDGDFYQYTAGARLEIPIANAEAKAKYAQAKIDTERSWLNLHELEENVTLEVKKAVSNLQSDLKSVEATRIARELAEENLRNQQARYDVGLATTKDILDFQDDVTRARREEIVSLTSYAIDLAELRRVEGTLLDARGVLVERSEPEAAPWWARF